jgi:hypothetical protein
VTQHQIVVLRPSSDVYSRRRNKHKFVTFEVPRKEVKSSKAAKQKSRKAEKQKSRKAEKQKSRKAKK